MISRKRITLPQKPPIPKLSPIQKKPPLKKGASPSLAPLSPSPAPLSPSQGPPLSPSLAPLSPNLASPKPGLSPSSPSLKSLSPNRSFYKPNNRSLKKLAPIVKDGPPIQRSTSLKLAEPKAPENGQLIKWRAGQVLGQGSEGMVLKAYDTDTGATFAVKQLFCCKPQLSIQDPVVDKLQQEVRILKDLSHPNIVQYLGSEIVDNIYCIYLEFLPGGTIHNLVNTLGPLPESRVKMYTKQLLAGLVYLHQHRVIHRDIKGANLLLDNKGKLKLTDFGSAKRYRNELDSGFVSTIRGSLAWTAPEIVQQGGYGRSCDVWSVGCTVIEMLTGKPPWQEEYITLLIKLAQTEELPPIPPGISQAAASFIELCVQRDPKLRPKAFALLNHEFLNT